MAWPAGWIDKRFQVPASWSDEGAVGIEDDPEHPMAIDAMTTPSKTRKLVISETRLCNSSAMLIDCAAAAP